jgi:hypothetical protein
MLNKPFNGHAETPYIIGVGSIVLGILWAISLVAKHEEYAPYIKVLIFIVSPLAGLVLLAAILAFVMVVAFIGEWVDKQIAKWRGLGKKLRLN